MSCALLVRFQLRGLSIRGEVFRGGRPLEPSFPVRSWVYGNCSPKIGWFSSALSEESIDIALGLYRVLVVKLRTFTEFMDVVVSVLRSDTLDPRIVVDVYKVNHVSGIR